MINLLLASAEGPTPDEIIAGAGEAVQGAVDEKISEAIDTLFKGLSSQLGFAILYTVVALAVLGLAVALLMYRFKRDRLKDYAKVAFGVVAGLAIMATVFMATVEFYQINNYEGGAPDATFKPILAFVCIAIGGGCLMGIASFFAGLLAAFIAAMVLMSRNFESSWSEWYSADMSQTGLIVSVVIGVLIMIGIFILGKKREVNNTRAIVYGAIAIAMSFALSYARFLKLPQGGSVTFASLLPLMIYCAMFGTRRGVVVCLIYGFLQALQDTYIIHPLQFLLDYPLAFGMISASGIFFERTPIRKNKLAAFIVGAIIAVVLRYACHICSGTFAFGADAPDTASSFFAYSAAYNSFTMVDLAIDLAAGRASFSSSPAPSAGRWTSPSSPPKAWRTTSPTRTRPSDLITAYAFLPFCRSGSLAPAFAF